MATMKVFVAFIPSLLVLLALISSQGHASQTITLWDGENFTYPAFEISQYLEDLSTYDFDDITSAACVTQGLWFLYEDGAFNTYSTANATVMYGIDFCSKLPDFMNNKVSSLRYAGPPVDYRQDSLQTYRKTNFAGAESYHLFDDNSVEIISPQSIAVTGNSSWTVYSMPLYQGESLCLTPGAQYPDPGLYPSTGLTWSHIYSLRKGCFSPKILEPIQATSPLFLRG